MELEPNESEIKSRIFPRHIRLYFVNWLKDHLDDPFPDKLEKEKLAKSTNLTIKQVSNWMINARRRILPLLSDENMCVNSKSTAAEILDYSEKFNKLQHKENASKISATQSSKNTDNKTFIETVGKAKKKKGNNVAKDQKFKKSKRASKKNTTSIKMKRKPRSQNVAQSKERMLSEPANNHLTTWLDSDVEDPYSHINEQKNFMCKTNFYANQVNNWFVNTTKHTVPSMDEDDLIYENPFENAEPDESNTILDDNAWIDTTNYLSERDLLFSTELPFESVAMVKEVLPNEEEVSTDALFDNEIY